MPTKPKPAETSLADQWPNSPGRCHVAAQGTEVALRLNRVTPPDGVANANDTRDQAAERLRGEEDFERLAKLRGNIAELQAKLSEAQAAMDADERAEEAAWTTLDDEDDVAEAAEVCSLLSADELKAAERRLRRARALEKKVEAALRSRCREITAAITGETMAAAKALQDDAVRNIREKCAADFDSLLRAVAMRRAATFPRAFDEVSTLAGLPKSPEKPMQTQTTCGAA